MLFGQDWRHTVVSETPSRNKNIISVRKAREGEEEMTETGKRGCDWRPGCLRGRPGCACGEERGRVASSRRVRRHSEPFEAFLISCTHELTGPSCDQEGPTRAYQLLNHHGERIKPNSTAVTL